MARPRLSTATILNLSASQRALLIAHIDGPVELSVADRHLMRTRLTLTRAGLLLGHPHNSPRPRKTALSDAGKQAVCAVLGEAADALVRAGLLQQGDPLAALRRLHAMRRDGGRAELVVVE